MVFIYTTCRDTADAKRLGRLIVEKRLAACVNITPIESIYVWKGKLTEEKEAALLIKTSESKVGDIEKMVAENHAYTTPFIGVLDLRRINREYKEWASTIIR